jgi:DNA-binding MarR family transcriptional regulator
MSGSPAGSGDFFNFQNELHALFTRTLEGMLGAEDITVPQVFTLKALKDQGGPCRMTDLAATRFHTAAAMTGIVDRLIILGLVERRADAADRRVILLSLTERGREVLAVMEKKMQGMRRRFFETVPEKDRETTMLVFAKLKAFLKEEINAQKKS